MEEEAIIQALQPVLNFKEKKNTFDLKQQNFNTNPRP